VSFRMIVLLFPSSPPSFLLLSSLHPPLNMELPELFSPDGILMACVSLLKELFLLADAAFNFSSFLGTFSASLLFLLTVYIIRRRRRQWYVAQPLHTSPSDPLLVSEQVRTLAKIPFLELVKTEMFVFFSSKLTSTLQDFA